MQQDIDFPGLAAALLARIDTLLPMWLPNGFKRSGYYYVGDFDGGKGKSANVKLKTGEWIDNSGGAADHGGDLISLYARIRGLTQTQAALELMRDQGWMAAPVATPKPKRAEPKWMPIHPVPADAVPYREQWAHYARGVPPMHWEYRDQAGQLLGITVRFPTSDGGKDVQPLSYCQGSNGQRMWKYKAFVEPRPLYGLWRLATAPAPADGGKPLAILVEGEKKADKLYEALGSQTPVLSWPGGCRVVHMADWAPLAGYRVVAWPDADAQLDKKTQQLLPRELQPGFQAMRKAQSLLGAMDVPVRLVDIGQPGDRPDGWDSADAVDEGWQAPQLWAFMRNLAPDATTEAPGDAAEAPLGAPPGPPPGPPPDDPPAPDGPDDADDEPGGEAGAAPGRKKVRSWRADYTLQKGAVRECVPNIGLVLSQHPMWKGVLAFDEFAQRVVKRKAAPYEDPAAVPEGKAVEWRDVDDTRTAAWIARVEQWVPSSSMVAEAATEVADRNRFHPVLDWLESLRHDGTPRLDDWAIDHCTVQDSPYVRLVSRFFLIGMCMRVLKPGCKFDTCLVLEGKQGRRKSALLSVLGGPWFSDIELDLANKDSMSNIRGKWLHEFGELGSLARAESTRQKSFLSRQVDEFRPVYGRREIRVERQTAFGGTTNEWAWNKDATGGRRFWPLEVTGSINVEGLAAIRDQLFAEAYACAKAHLLDRTQHRYWPTDEEQAELFDPEQLAREAPDAYLDLLAVWLDSAPMSIKETFTLAEACMDGLKLDAKSLTKDVQTRVGICLRKLECERVERRTQVPRFVYKRPQRNAASSQAPGPAPAESQEVPF